MSSAAVVIGALRVNKVMKGNILFANSADLSEQSVQILRCSLFLHPIVRQTVMK